MGKYFTIKFLVDIGLPGFPKTAQGWEKLVKSRGWEFIQTPGRGRGGVRREYLPPPEVMALIDARQRGETLPEPPRKAVVQAPAPAPEHQTQRYEAASTPAPRYEAAPPGPTPEMKDEWLAVALSAVDEAVESSDKEVAPMTKAGIFKEVFSVVACYGSQQRCGALTMDQIETLVKPYAKLLVDKQPSFNGLDPEYQRVKDRLAKERSAKGGGAKGGGSNGDPVH